MASVSANNQHYLAFMQDIYEVSQMCSTTTYIWGGFVIDIIEGEFTREHHDLDGFTLNLLEVLPDMTAFYKARGYFVEFRDDFDILVISRDGLHAAFNRLENDGAMMIWRHIGDEGAVYFPSDWLDDEPREFYGKSVYTSGLQFDYLLKTNTRMLNPEWKHRQKDNATIERLEKIISKTGLNPKEFLSQAWSYNPFWAKRGYPEYAMPMVAYLIPTTGDSI